MDKPVKGVGQCLICKAFIDNPENFTCGNPQCDTELRKRNEIIDQAKNDVRLGKKQGAINRLQRLL